MEASKTVLFTLRTYKHLPYIYRLINEVAASFRCVIHVDERWDADSLAQVQKSPLLIPGVEVAPAIRLSVFQRVLCELKEFYTYIYYENRFGGRDFYTKRWRSYQRLFRPLSFLARSSHVRRYLQARSVRAFLARFYRSKSLSRYYEENNVKAVICTSLNLRFSNEDFYLQTANAHCVRSYYPVLTWDNLSTKGSFIPSPSAVFCFNSSQLRQIKKWHRLESAVEISGSLFFEKWGDLRQAIGAAEYSTNRQYILYLGSSSNIVGDERHIINLLKLVLCKINQALGSNIGLVVKNHPAKINRVDRSLGISVYDDFGLCESQDHELRYAMLLRNARAVFGVNTSGLIDATFVNGNVYALTDVGKSRQVGVLHFEEMCECFGIKKISFQNVEALEERLQSLVANEPASEYAFNGQNEAAPSRFMKEYICAEMA